MIPTGSEYMVLSVLVILMFFFFFSRLNDKFDWRKLQNQTVLPFHKGTGTIIIFTMIRAVQI